VTYAPLKAAHGLDTERAAGVVGVKYRSSSGLAGPSAPGPEAALEDGAEVGASLGDAAKTTHDLHSSIRAHTCLHAARQCHAPSAFDPFFLPFLLGAAAFSFPAPDAPLLPAPAPAAGAVSPPLGAALLHLCRASLSDGSPTASTQALYPDSGVGGVAKGDSGPPGLNLQPLSPLQDGRDRQTGSTPLQGQKKTPPEPPPRLRRNPPRG
jgi:hypothetical protein